MENHSGSYFYYVAVLAATAPSLPEGHEVFNVAVGDRTTLNELYAAIREQVARWRPEAVQCQPVYRDFRAGDVRHSQADISKAASLLGYAPTHRVAEGLDIAAPWYAQLFGATA